MAKKCIKENIKKNKTGPAAKGKEIRGAKKKLGQRRRPKRTVLGCSLHSYLFVHQPQGYAYSPEGKLRPAARFPYSSGRQYDGCPQHIAQMCESRHYSVRIAGPEVSARSSILFGNI